LRFPLMSPAATTVATTVAEPVGTSRRLVLLRHGRTAWNLLDRAQGHADVGLDEVGHAQAAAAAPRVADMRPAAAWSSDLARARETAAYLERETGVPAKLDARLREFDVGERQGLTRAEFAERFPREYDAWIGGDLSLPVPGAETTGDVAARMLPALRECVDSLRAGETGVVVTHGAALKVAIPGMLAWPHELGGDLRGMDNCAWAVLQERDFGGRLRLVSYNITAAAPDFASVAPVG